MQETLTLNYDTTKFNPMQVQLLRMFSYVKTEEQMIEIKSVLSEYFFRKVEEGMDALESSGQWSREKERAVLREHLRTPYQH